MGKVEPFPELNYLSVSNDVGGYVTYFTKRFITIKDIRKNKLNKIFIL